MKFVRERDLRAAAPEANKFTAGVWQTEALRSLHDEGLRGHRFVYQPGAHSHWHTHTGEQAIVVLAGRGVAGLHVNPISRANLRAVPFAPTDDKTTSGSGGGVTQ
jgi:quercetin dioxygenase-like cupin family protein